ncbi:MAG: Y-family DNA polymerase [Paludibacteraceae bacterium]|nr:Y-family DNA polymerase [Paludibacteraceae bacterium]
MMYALCDCNNFFVSCERVFRPDLWGKPVVVLSGNDGCVVARSNEVKALGVKMGVPLYQIEGLVKKHHITCFSSNFSLYGDLSDRVMSILRTHTTRFEQYSIDEAFISVDHVPESERKTFCEQIVREIGQGVGIPVSMGIAPTKTLAKVASKYAKQYAGYHGACAIDSEERRRKALQDFPIADVWGIGRKAKAKMEMANIKTALQFADKPEMFARRLLNKPGMLTWRELNGVDSIDTSELLAKQSITTSRTFASPVTTHELLEQQLANFCDACARKLRQQHSVCTQAVVFARTSRFRTDIEQDAIALTVNFPVATSDTREMLGYILGAFRARFREGIQYKQAGVVLTRILPETAVMEDLFDVRDRQKEKRLQRSVDAIRERCGRGVIMLGTQLPLAGTEQQQIYKQEHHSPRYTTDITQLLRIKV